MLPRIALLCLAVAGLASAQAMAEYGLAAGKGAVGAAAAAKGLSKAIKGVTDKTEQTMKDAKSVQVQPAVGGKTDAKPADTPEVKYEDPAGLKAEMLYVEVLRRFGPPAMSISDGDTKMLTYASKTGQWEVEVQGDKIKSVRKMR